jgi:hypothetical protein
MKQTFVANIVQKIGRSSDVDRIAFFNHRTKIPADRLIHRDSCSAPSRRTLCNIAELAPIPA